MRLERYRIMMSFMIYTLHQNHDNHIKEDEMRGTRTMHGRDQKCLKNFDLNS